MSRIILSLLCLLMSTQALALRTDSIMPEDSVVVDTLADATESLDPLPVRLQKLLDNDIFERTQVGIYIYDLTADSLVFTHNERQCMRPASNEKLMTAIVALHDLGVNYQFRTRLYADPLPTDSDSIYTGHIYIRAGYDPLLDGDDLHAFADSLKARGITHITSPIRLEDRKSVV